MTTIDEFAEALEKEIKTFLSVPLNKENYPNIFLYLKHRNREDTVALLHSVRELRR